MDVDGDVDVIIIGAGVSGLSAAYQLWKKDSSIRVLVLEAKDRVGGRTLTVKLKAANGEDDFDLGGQWVGSCQPDIMALLKELNLETYMQYSTGTKCMQLGSGHRIKHYENGLPALSIPALLDLHFFMRRIEKMCEFVPIDNPAECPYADEWDSMTFETCCRKYLWTKAAKEAIDAGLACIYGALPKDVSCLYFLYYCKTAGGIKAVIETGEGSGQEFKIKGGAQQISHKIIGKIGKENVKLNCPVKAITRTANSVCVETSSGKTIKCQRVIIATPPNMVGQMCIEPGLPLVKKEMYQRSPLGHIIKVLITYKKAFWKDSGFSGEIVTNGGKSTSENCDYGPLCIVFDATTSSGSPGLVAFLGGQQAIEWSGEREETRKTAILSCLAECFGQEAFDYINYHEKNWAEEPYNGGCPVGAVVPGAMKYFTSGLREPCGSLHFAGTETASCWCGFINGAVQAGTRAANEVLYHIRPQTLTADDIAMTWYGPKTSKPLPKCSKKRTMIKWTLGIGSVLALSIVVTKIINSQTS